MDIKGFAFRHCRQTSKENLAIIDYCISNKIPYKFYKKPEEKPQDFIPSGSVEWCENFLPKEKTIPNYYPEFLKDYLFRNVWRSDQWPLNPMMTFIKPADRHKRYNGFVITAYNRKKKRGPHWCSDFVIFSNEWRYYVADGKVLCAEWYQGDEVNTPDAPELNIEIPKDYCGALDFGILNNGKFALVEANSPYACGWYGKNNKLYAEWIIKGWKYLTKI